MKKLFSALACAISALALAGAAPAQISFGVADDLGKGAPDAGFGFVSQLHDIGLRENRITVLWDPANPTTIVDQPLLDRYVPTASALGIRVVFTVYSTKATALTSSPVAPAQFANYLQLLARTYPQVKDYTIGNEPNVSRFWQPQFNRNGSPASPAAFQALLARSYDALKAVDPGITVIGVGLSPRGNDNPRAKSNISMSPVRFIRELGRAYRASGRRAPIMDHLGFHPYPDKPTDSLAKGYPWPNAGVPNLDRIKQAVSDAFRGTAQRTFENGLKLRLNEVGWQVGILPSARGAYYGQENVPVIDEGRQGKLYGDLVRLLACDPHVASVHLFGLIDEPNLARWQAALLRADGTRRASYETVKAAIAETRGRCTRRTTPWRPTKRVVRAGVRFGNLKRPASTKRRAWGFRATAAEDALYRASIVRVGRARATRRLLLRPAARVRPVLTAHGRIKANWTPLIRFPARKLKAGTYAYRLRMSAAMNPARVSVFASKPFRVGAKPKRAAKAGRKHAAKRHSKRER